MTDVHNSITNHVANYNGIPHINGVPCRLDGISQKVIKYMLMIANINKGGVN